MSTLPNYDLRSCTPNRQQKLLLHAALDSGDEAQQAWRQWRDQIDLDKIDPASFRLLPMAYRNMSALGQEDPLVNRLKGIYRHSWYRNQILYRQAQGVLADFEQAGLPTLLLKGAALSQRFYRDVGIRFMNDVDFLVHEKNYAAAASILMAQGWRPALYSPEAMFWYHRHRFKHGCGFQLGNVELDLHSRLLRFTPMDEQTLWSDSVRGNWQGRQVHFLSDTDQLLHTCVHGLRWSYAYLTWIPDALVILRDEKTRVDWRALVEKARQTRTIPYLRNALAFLVAEFHAPVPLSSISQLDELPLSRIERGEFQLLGEEQTRRVPYRAKRVLYHSCRYHWYRHGKQKPIALSMTAWLKFLYLHAYPPGWWQPVKRFFTRSNNLT